MAGTDDVEILLVEDNEADAELTLRSLRKNRLAKRVQVARDGAEALDFVFCQGAFEGRDFHARPRLMLVDLKLPKVNGLEVIRAVKEDPRTKSIPMVILTSSREEVDLKRSYQLGVNSYLQKPVEYERFQEVVRDLGSYWMQINIAPPKSASA